jgi:hypothetical protein
VKVLGVENGQRTLRFFLEKGFGRDYVKAQLSTDVHHGSRGRHKIRFADVVAGFFAVDYATDEVHKLLIGSAPAHQFMKVVVPHRK